MRPDAPVTHAELQEFRGEVQVQFQSFRDEFRAFQGRLFAKLEEGSQRTERRFEAVDARFDEMNGRFDDVYSRLDTLGAEYTMITEGLKRLEGRS